MVSLLGALIALCRLPSLGAQQVSAERDVQTKGEFWEMRPGLLTHVQDGYLTLVSLKPRIPLTLIKRLKYPPFSALPILAAMVRLETALINFLGIVSFIYPHANQDMKRGLMTDFMDVVSRDHPHVASILPNFLRPLSPHLHPPKNLPLFPVVIPQPKQGTWIIDESVAPVDPSQDPFYTPDPSLYEHLENGDIIAIRRVGLSAVLSNASTSYQISFRSESTSGSPTADLTVLIIPDHYDNKTLLSYQEAEDSAFLKCAPSYSVASGDNDPLMNLALNEGWALNIPDHQGISSAFAAGIYSGKTTLDSIRAVKNAESMLGFSFENLGLHGYSGGSIATGHALELQPSYAPDVTLTCAAVGGYIVNLTSTFETINGGLFAGFCPPALIGLSTEYPELDKMLQTAFRPGYRDRFYSSIHNCASGDLANFLGQDIFTYVTAGNSFLYNSTVQDVLNENSLGKVAPSIPLFVYHGVRDEIAPIAEVDKAVDFYCQSGARVEYSRQNSLAHLTTAVMSTQDVLNYFKRTFDGQLPANCASHQDAIDPHQHSPSLKDISTMISRYL